MSVIFERSGRIPSEAFLKICGRGAKRFFSSPVANPRYIYIYIYKSSYFTCLKYVFFISLDRYLMKQVPWSMLMLYRCNFFSHFSSGIKPQLDMNLHLLTYVSKTKPRSFSKFFSGQTKSTIVVLCPVYLFIVFVSSRHIRVFFILGQFNYVQLSMNEWLYFFKYGILLKYKQFTQQSRFVSIRTYHFTTAYPNLL